VIAPPAGYDVHSWIGAAIDVEERSSQVKIALGYRSPRGSNAPRSAILVFDLDGPTRSAVIVDDDPDRACLVQVGQMSQHKIALRAVGKRPSGTTDYGSQAVLGRNADGPLANLVYRWDPPAPEGWLMSASVSSDLLVISTGSGDWAAADWSSMQWNSVYQYEDDPTLESSSAFVPSNGLWTGLDASNLRGCGMRIRSKDYIRCS